MGTNKSNIILDFEACQILVDCQRDFRLYLEDEGHGDANDEEEGRHDEIRHSHP
jgi:hypothetical protein